VARAVGLGHAGDRGPLPPEPLDDRVVHLQAPLGLHIEVDVRQRRTPLAEEPLEQQPVVERVGRGDEQRVVDHGAGAGAPRGDPDPQRPGVRDHLGHGQEVPLEAQPADDLQLVVELSYGRLVRVQDPGDHARLAPLPQQPHGRPALGAGADDGRFGEVGPSELEIGRSEGAGLAGGLGLGQQADRSGGVVADGLGDTVGGRRHGVRALQPAFAAVQVPPVHGPKQPG
jgi:hypothetical protein